MLRLSIQELHAGFHGPFSCVSLRSNFTLTNSIQIQDIFVSAAFGWPTCIKGHEFDVRPLTKEDFESPDIQSSLFIELAKIVSILGNILDLRWRSTKHVQTQVCAPRGILHKIITLNTFILTSAAITAYRYPPFLKGLDPRSSNCSSHF